MTMLVAKKAASECGHEECKHVHWRWRSANKASSSQAQASESFAISGVTKGTENGNREEDFWSMVRRLKTLEDFSIEFRESTTHDRCPVNDRTDVAARHVYA